MILSATVERLVRRIVILEESIYVDKEKLKLIYQKKMAFIWIG